MGREENERTGEIEIGNAVTDTDTRNRLPREILLVEDRRKGFHGLEVLRGVTFCLSDREILGVIGPSGGGKTTLLKCLNLLEWPTSGRIRYPGKLSVRASGGHTNVVRDVEAGEELRAEDLCVFRRELGFVFQGFNLWEDRSVLSNLLLAPRAVLGEARNSAEERAKALAKQFGIDDKLQSGIAQLSGGQRQRVAIVRALMMQPRVMLLDEITSALDPVLTVEVMQAIRQLRDRGLAMIVVTHHLEFAPSLCDRIMFLSGGMAVQIDSPERLRSHPATREVSEFLDVLVRAR